MTLAEQLKALKGKLNAENDLGGQKDTAKIAELETQIADLNIQILAETQQAQTQEIAQAQEERIASITLPFNFNEVFDDPRANEMIVELIKEFQVEANEEYNAKLKDINAAHLEELRAATDRELQLKRQNDELQQANQLIASDRDQAKERLQELSDEHGHAVELLNETKLRLNDAESKRDAAVREKEGIELLLTEKQAQIDKLRDEIAIGAVAAVNVVDISPSERLAKLVEESKQAKVKSAIDIALENTAPFRGKVLSGGAVVQLNAPEEATFRPIDPQAGNTVNSVDTTESVNVPAENQVEAFRGEGEVQTVRPGVDQGNSTVEVAGKALEERVKALELHVFGSVFMN